MRCITIYEVRYFNLFTDTSYVATTDRFPIFKQFLAQLNSHACILMLAGNTTTIREYTDDEYYPNDTTLELYTSEIDDTSLYMTQFMMEQAQDIIHGDIAYTVSALPSMLAESAAPYCKGLFKDRLMRIVMMMTQRVIIDSKDSCIDVVKGICSFDLFFSNMSNMTEYPFGENDGEED